MSRMTIGVRGWSRFAAGIAAVALVSGLALAAQAPAAATNTAAKAAAVPVRLDLNKASKERLAKLPGVTDEYAQKIIDGRPYKNETELSTRKIVPKEVYDQISEMVIAREQ